MTKKEAQEAARSAMEADRLRWPAFRSCWECNPAHEHLKKTTVLCCFMCQNWYYEGIKITEEE